MMSLLRSGTQRHPNRWHVSGGAKPGSWIMKRLAAFAACLLIGIGLIGIGSAAAQPPPPPYATVPPPRVETVPPPPGGQYVWEPGHWHWNGARYVWVGGHYVVRGPHYGHWVEGRWAWAPNQGRWVWRPAHWE
jgi:hypothetical protein